MLSCVRNVANPGKLRAANKNLLLKWPVIFTMAGVFPRMLVVPNPVLDVPCRQGSYHCVPATGFCLKMLVCGQDNFIPKFFSRRKAEIDVLDTLASRSRALNSSAQNGKRQRRGCLR